MITKDFYTLLESNGGELNICGIKFKISDNDIDIDIYIDGKLYKWIIGANKREMFLSDLTNVECGENTEFIEVFAKDYINSELKEITKEKNRYYDTVIEREDEIRTLKEKNYNIENGLETINATIVELKFLKDFLRNRDLIIHT